MWVDDGDAKTEEGELQTLQQHGITEIKVPTDHNDFVGDYTKEETVETTEKGTAQRADISEETDEDTENDNQEENTTPVSGIKGTLTLSSVANFFLLPEKESSNKDIEELDKKIISIKKDKSLKEPDRKKELERLLTSCFK